MKKISHIGKEAGFTLVEMMVTLVIVGVVIAGVAVVYTQMQKTHQSQEIKADLQQKSRNALDRISREIMMAGFQGKMLEKNPTEIEFSEFIQSQGATRRIRYRYDTASHTLMRGEKENSDTASYTNTEEVIADGVQGVTFAYYDKDNGTATTLDKVRRITVQITMNSSKVDPTIIDPITKKPTTRTIVLKADLVPRNLAEGEAPIDSIPPTVPTGLRVIDNRDCSSLELKWNANPETDVAGYYITYGTQTGVYTNVLTIPIFKPGFNKGAPEYKLAGLSITPYTSRFTNPVKYYFKIQAYDNSMNYSDFSAEVSGPSDLSTDVTSFSQSGNDSVLNPAKPAAPANLRAYNMNNNASGLSCGENQVRLTWAASAGATVGYRLYRSTTPFTTFPISPDYVIADETGSKGADKLLSPSTTTFLDTVPISCTDYYYAITTINCDPSLIYGISGNPLYPAMYSSSSDYALTDGDPGTSGIQGVQAKSTSPPPDPDLAGSKGGWKRVFINMQNPFLTADPPAVSCPDYDHTYLYFSDQQMPYFDSNGNVTGMGCQLVWDSGANPYIRGKFTDPGNSVNNSFVFNSATRNLGNYDYPELVNDHTYYFFAVAFDKCGNRSAGSTTAKTLATLCGDDPPGAPPAPTGITVDGCGDVVTLNWSWPAGAYTAWLDLQGYRVYRNSTGNFSGSFDFNTGTPAGSTFLGGPLWDISWSDASIQDGGTYYYCVRATDCRWENDTTDQSDYTTIKQNNITTPGTGSVTGPITPGRIIRYTYDISHDPPQGNELYDFVTSYGVDPADLTTTTSYHNAVQFYIQNTSAGNVDINQIQLSWGNSAAYLKQIIIGGAPGSSIQNVLTFSTPVSSADAAAGKTLTAVLTESDSKASGIGTYSKAIPVRLVFTNQDGTVDGATDMRGDQLNAVFQFRNDSTGKGDCKAYMDSAHSNPINVPLTPTIYSTTINVPRPGSPAFDIPGSTAPAHTDTNDHPVAMGGVNVLVSASVYDNEQFNFYDGTSTTVRNAHIADGKVYYAVTPQGTHTPAGYTFSPLTGNSISFTDYAINGTIPPQADQRVWYYFTATSTTGNTDRLPQPQNGYFMYDQGSFNPCAHIPTPPTGLTYTLSGNNVTISWTAPDKYTDGNTLDVYQDPLKYNVFKKIGVAGPYNLVASGVTTTTYADPVAMNDPSVSNNVFYKVKATNSCTNPGPKVSDYSNEVAVCYAGAAGCAIITGSSSAMLSSNFGAGGTFALAPVDLKVYICNRAGDGYTWATFHPLSDIIVRAASSANAEASAMTFYEVGDTGVFTRTGNLSDPNNYINLTANALAYNMSHTDTTQGATTKTSLTDTITFSVDPSTTICSGVSTAVVVTTDPCSNTPSPPGGLNGTRDLSTGDTAKTISLTWSKPTTNSDGSTINDLAGYKIYVRDDGGKKGNPAGSTVWVNVASVTNPNTTSQAISLNGNHDYSIYITAYDTCSLGIKESAASDVISLAGK